MVWCPADLLGGRPHVLVDGAALPNTVLCLSHWPASPTPRTLRRDTSTGSALAFVSSSKSGAPASLVATDHLDQDGLAAAWCLLHPERALELAPRLEALAMAGDFAVVSDREAARASFALATLADEERSPLDPSLFAGGGSEGLGLELLERLAELLRFSQKSRELWREEDASFEASLADLEAGRVTIEEVPPLDLAVVTISPDVPERRATRFLSGVTTHCHPGALHAATRAGRLLFDEGDGSYRLSYRYESWVRLVSRKTAPRADLSLLAEALEDAEPRGCGWSFDGVSALLPVLSPGAGRRSELAFSTFRRMAEEWLASAPAAWGPEGPVRARSPRRWARRRGHG